MKKFLVSLLVIAMMMVPMAVISAAEGEEEPVAACACAEDCVQCRIKLMTNPEADMTAQCSCVKLPEKINEALNKLLTEVIIAVNGLYENVVKSIFGKDAEVKPWLPVNDPYAPAPVDPIEDPIEDDEII